MYFKISIRNFKRSLADYSIYFFTLVLGVSIFYVFNAIVSQRIISNFSKLQHYMFHIFSIYISVSSIFISFILGFLIIYANNFIISKRKKEFGIYMTLGMSKASISLFLLLENIAICCFSLIIGLALGIFLSQGLSALTAKLFIMKVPNFSFAFFNAAAIKTIICFTVLFISVSLFNYLSISLTNLIDLMSSTARSKNPLLQLSEKKHTALLLISIIAIVYAYNIVLQNDLSVIESRFYLAVFLGFVGTFLFFMSLSDFLKKLIISRKKIYLKELNIFILRQLTSKFATSYISMAVICLTLFFSISVLASGISLKKVFYYSSRFVTPFDASMSVKTSKKLSLMSKLKTADKKIKETLANSVEYYEYSCPSPLSFEIFLKDSENKEYEKIFSIIKNSFIPAISISDYNKLLRLNGRKAIALNKNKLILISNTQNFNKVINNYIKRHSLIKINNKSYYFESRHAIFTSIETTQSPVNYLTIVMPDKDIEGFSSKRIVLSLNYSGNKDVAEREFMTASINCKKLLDKEPGIKSYITCTKISSIQTNNALPALLLFAGLYIAVIFLIVSAAILALRQLAGASDDIYRYTVLMRMGVDRKMINKAIFSCVFIYFITPLLLAIAHSIVGILFVFKQLSVYNTSSMLLPSMATSLIICIIYGSYFIITYNGYKNFINNSLK